ncbi:gliding motility protein GldN [Hymenobacter busanensis]|uniref:Gliding motility protein GldN n=1 Tax=Hymenobacter busanensis TaxID=2607656 RepID=A0A7L4ZZC5_9BACT|nr:gliding motility protein GldN [Hymenobacter busanensis]KAA9331466.1 gliding motility protein GldN [Hymenobacter busanensis]QHJ08621.1 gliding motility protein GldN [Hymenobacter busanensis]
MNKFFSFAALAAGLTLSVSATAQEQATTASSNGSYRPIPNSDIMFRKTVWRAIDLREKQNKPMFSEGKEISRVIMEAVKRGELQAYKNDSLTSTYNPQEVSANMSYAEASAGLSDEEKAAGFTQEDTSTDDGWGTPAPKKGAKGKKAAPVKKTPPPPASYEYRYKDIYQMELKEDMIFDKKRSRMYHDIKTVTLLVPSTLSSNVSGIEKPIGTFKYSDLVKVFRANPDKAIWFNPQNDAQHKNLADAFELWLFNSYIVKVSNPSDSRLDDIYGGQQQGVLAASQAAADLIEYEYSLWSF